MYSIDLKSKGGSIDCNRRFQRILINGNVTSMFPLSNVTATHTLHYI